MHLYVNKAIQMIIVNLEAELNAFCQTAASATASN